MFSKDGKGKDVATPRICDVVWHDGEFIAWNDARVHVMSHVLHYGSSIFEGIRCYATKQGPAIFRLKEHMQRFLNSAKIYRMDHNRTLEQLCDASVELVRRSGLDQCYIRPILFRSLDEARPAFGVNPFPNPLACYIGAWDWGKYLGDEAIEKGVDVCVSTWNRLTPNSMPAMAKSGANYMNSQLIKMEALLNGFAEGIALDDRGHGQSTKLYNDADYHTDLMAGDVAALIAHLKLGRADVMGYSLGARISATLAARHPDEENRERDRGGKECGLEVLHRFLRPVGRVTAC